jgi:hypothetical protein
MGGGGRDDYNNNININYKNKTTEVIAALSQPWPQQATTSE